MARRILLLITDLEIGGTPTVVRELALRLAAAGGAQIEVACLSRWGPVADQIAQGGVRVSALGAKGSLGFPLILWRLAKLIWDRRIDTVLSFLLHANVVSAAASAFCTGVRWLQSIQTTQANPRWHWKMQSIVHRAADQIVVPSASVAQVAREWANVPGGKIVVIPNAVSGTGIPRGTGDGGATRAGFIGRLDPIKRVPDLLEAMTLLDPSVHLHIFGDGAERPHIEATILRLGLRNRVTLHGVVPRAQEALAQIDLLVLPSQAEGFGLVLIEAMAAGVPVVATNVPGIRDVVRHGETGWLVPVSSPASLAAGIALLLKDANLRAEFVARARDDVRLRFSWEAVLPQYRKLLRIPV